VNFHIEYVTISAIVIFLSLKQAKLNMPKPLKSPSLHGLNNTLQEIQPTAAAAGLRYGISSTPQKLG
jgi:hypothetical protein